jgi:septal ring factor EnvC (AmiA/AmiB activator)
MAGFMLGFLISALVGGILIYNCYAKREITEKRLKQNVANLEHNLEMIRRESGLRVEQLNKELIKTKEHNKKAFMDIDVLHKDLRSVAKQLEDCRSRLEEG